MTGAPDFAVIGGGLVGASLAYGLGRLGLSIALFDAGEDRLHASAGNFGLVWVQGKGADAPDYARLSRRSADAWGAFADALGDRVGASLGYRACGGVKIALGEAEMEAMAARVARAHNRPERVEDGTRLIDRGELLDLVPAVGPEAVGGSHNPHDGHADPLATIGALHAALPTVGARVVRAKADRVEPQASGFTVHAGRERHPCGRVVLAAGLGGVALAPALGLDAPLRPQRGQIVVTERLEPFLDLACHTLRQTGDGTVMMGDSHEEVGHDHRVTREVATAIMARAVRCFPRLAAARVVRIWGALRILSPDGLPVYAASERHPGASLVSCHSGVTLAAAHAGEVARAVAEDRLAEAYPAFSPDRFGAAA